MFDHPLSFVVFPAGGRARTVLLSLALALVMIACPLASQAAYDIWKVADESTKMPGFYSGQHYFREFGLPAIDDKHVVWYGAGELSGVFGIFIHDGSTNTSSSVHVIVNSLNYPPGGSVQFSSFDKSPSLNENWITFLGRAANATYTYEVGIYKAYYTGVLFPPLNKLIDRGSAGLGICDDLSSPAGGGALNAVFLADIIGSNSGNSEKAVFAKYGGTIYKLADTDLDKTGGQAKFSGFDRRPAMDKNYAFFYAKDTSSNPAIYGVDPRIGTLITVADANTKDPTNNANFTDFKCITSAYRRIFFYGETSAGKGIYGSSDIVYSPLGTLIDSSKHSLIEPMVALDCSFSQSAPSYIAWVSGPGYPILWHHVVNKSPNFVLDTLSSLNKKAVSLIKLGPNGLNDDSLAFLVRFSDQSQAIYRADRLVAYAFYQSAPLAASISEEEYLSGQPFTWNLAISGEDLGLAQALWVGPEYANSHLIRVDGSALFSVTPPEEVDPENIYEVVVFDPESGEMLRDPVQVPGGVRLDFRELGFDEGVRSFAIRGATLDEGYRGRMPLGLIFSRGDAVANVQVKRCADELERCGER